MSSRQRYLFGISLMFGLIVFTILPAKLRGNTSNFTQTIYPITECNDGIDNDGDGGIDFATDSDCTSWTDDSETIEVLSQPQTEQPVNTGSSSPQNIIEFVNDIRDTIPSVLQSFVWEPLGRIFGEDVAKNIDRIKNDEDMSILFFVGVGYILTLIVGAILVINKYNEKKA